MPNTDEQRLYQLDGLGNWIQSDYIPVGGTPSIDLRQHNKLNEITSRKVGNAAKANFVYDANGNLRDDGTILYSYDALNRLIEVRRKSDNQIIGQYVYDAQNRRVRKAVSNGGLTTNVPNVTVDFIYCDWQVMQEINNSSTIAKQYVWGDYIDECIQLRTYVTSGAGDLAAGLYYPLQDLLYRTQALTNSSGEIVEAYDYDAYGNTLIFSAAGTGNNWWADDATQADYAACEMLYCGYRYDAESKTYQVRNRQYNPALGRWIQRDPIGFDGGDWNLYGYAQKNPVLYQDSDGRVVHIIVAAGAGAVLGGATNAIAQYASTGKIDATELAVATGAGAIAGGLLPLTASISGAVMLGASVGGWQYVATQGLKDKPIDGANLALSVGLGGLGGRFGGAYKNFAPRNNFQNWLNNRNLWSTLNNRFPQYVPPPVNLWPLARSWDKFIHPWHLLRANNGGWMNTVNNFGNSFIANYPASAVAEWLLNLWRKRGCRNFPQYLS